MRKIVSALYLTAAPLCAGTWDAYAGTHFNYTQIDFDAPSSLQGYTGGADAGIGCKYGGFFSQIGFEGSWNAGPITGTPCQRSSTTEYFLEWKLGWSISAWRRQLFIDPYTGFGWDRFYNTQDPAGADLAFRYDKLFVPVGLYLYWRFYDCTRLGVQFEYRPDVYAKLDLIGISLDAKGEEAYRVQIPLVLESCCHRFNLSFVPFFDWSEYGRVEETNSAGALLAIPELIKWEIGLRMILDLKY